VALDIRPDLFCCFKHTYFIKHIYFLYVFRKQFTTAYFLKLLYFTKKNRLVVPGSPVWEVGVSRSKLFFKPYIIFFGNEKSCHSFFLPGSSVLKIGMTC
jgi:hypothetical protein